ncbi:MAG TPA: sulfate ABC transporter substrate-binding protein [Mycobacteriales bacterium]
MRVGILRAVVALLLTASLSGCVGTAATGGGAVRLSLVAYSTPQEAYGKIIAAFQKTPEGRNVTFSQSYGASGDQSRAVAAGLKADIVAFSLEPDLTRLVKQGIVAADWENAPAGGMVTDSVVIIGTRKGNPEELTGWSDLTKAGVEVLTPNPFTSGGARWNVLAAYGATSARGTQHARGVEYLGTLFGHVPVQDDSARKSLQTFTSGKGDAILAYENEAIFAQSKGQALDYTIPDSTILIENPAAVTVNSAHPEEAGAFLAFLHGPVAQKIFADNGYRPTAADVPGARSFPTPPGLFTIADLGGWDTADARFFDPAHSVMADVERRLGVSTGKK